MKRAFTRDQKNTIVNSIGLLVGLLVILQLWLLTATMNSWMGGDPSVAWPAAVASGACFVINLLLLRRLNFLAGDKE